MTPEAIKAVREALAQALKLLGEGGLAHFVRVEESRLAIGEALALLAAEQGAEPQVKAPFDMVAHLTRQRAWSEKTFGPGRRTKGVIDHISKELAEIEADPTDLSEWIDVVILAFDGAWRAGWEPEKIVEAITAKQAKNESRNWPNWRTVSQDHAIEHDRSAEGAKAPPVLPSSKGK